MLLDLSQTKRPMASPSTVRLHSHGMAPAPNDVRGTVAWVVLHAADNELLLHAAAMHILSMPTTVLNFKQLKNQ
jgi:hypothetical protein